MNKKTFMILSIVGVVVIYLVAVFLHFVFDLTNGCALAVLFGAVNESVWEHVKIFAAGFVLWAIIELLWVRPPFCKFVVAKTLSLYLLSVLIIVFFYTYNLLTEGPILILDIIASFVFVAVSQYISYKLTTSKYKIEDYFSVAVMLLMMFFVMFFSFTIFPPKTDLFKDPVTNTYGIVGKYLDNGAFYLDKT